MGQDDPCMPDKPVEARNYFLACYAVSLVQGESIRGKPLRSRTVKNYLSDAYKLFAARSLAFDSLLTTNYVHTILHALSSYENVPNRREMITDGMMRWLLNESKRRHEDNELAAIVDWLILGRYTGFRQSEWCQTSQSSFKRIEEWPGQPPLAFIMSDIIFMDKNKRRINLTSSTSHDDVFYIAIRWRKQKNGENGEEITFARDLANPAFCPVLATLRIVTRARRLGTPADVPIGVFSKKGQRLYISASLVAKYLRLAASTVLNISLKDEYINRWSTHSVRVTAANLLHRERFADSFIQKRLRWKSTSFLDYLRNTFYAAEQHAGLKLSDSNLPPTAERVYRADEPHEALTAAAA